MRVLIDTDVVLDLLLKRIPFSAEATAIWDANSQGRCEAFVCAVTPVNVFYIVRKFHGLAVAQYSVQSILLNLQICPVNIGVLEAAYQSSFTDFEDAVQHFSALEANVDCIVTRNIKDYTGATLPVYTPGNFLTQLL